MDSGSIEALTYDVKGNQLVGLRNNKLIVIDPAALKITDEVDAPIVEGTGPISLSVDHRDQSIFMSREDSSEVTTA